MGCADSHNQSSFPAFCHKRLSKSRRFGEKIKPTGLNMFSKRSRWASCKVRCKMALCVTLIGWTSLDCDQICSRWNSDETAVTTTAKNTCTIGFIPAHLALHSTCKLIFCAYPLNSRRGTDVLRQTHAQPVDVAMQVMTLKSRIQSLCRHQSMTYAGVTSSRCNHQAHYKQTWWRRAFFQRIPYRDSCSITLSWTNQNRARSFEERFPVEIQITWGDS